METKSRQQFVDTVNEIAQALDGPWNGLNLNEATVRQVIVLRLLAAAGFNIWNPTEVVAEAHNPTGGRVDLEIRIDEHPCFVLELKRLDASLNGKETVQAINYASAKGIRWAMTTNGRTWKLFDTNILNCPAIEKLVLEVRIKKLMDDEVANRLFGLLSRRVWANRGTEKLVLATRGLPITWMLKSNDETYEFDGSMGRITVGRESDNDLRLDDESVSRYHAIFEIQNHMLFVTDLAATNTVKVNNARVIPHQQFQVPNGGLVVIGCFRMLAMIHSRLEQLNVN